MRAGTTWGDVLFRSINTAVCLCFWAGYIVSAFDCQLALHFLVVYSIAAPVRTLFSYLLSLSLKRLDTAACTALEPNA